MVRSNHLHSKIFSIAPIIVSLALLLSPVLAQDVKEDQEAKKEEKKRSKSLKKSWSSARPRRTYLATVSTLESTEIEGIKARDSPMSSSTSRLDGHVWRQGHLQPEAPGRQRQRIALLVDGVRFTNLLRHLRPQDGFGRRHRHSPGDEGAFLCLYGRIRWAPCQRHHQEALGEAQPVASGSFGDKNTRGLGLDTSFRLEAFRSRRQRPLTRIRTVFTIPTRPAAGPSERTAISNALTSTPSFITRLPARPRSCQRRDLPVRVWDAGGPVHPEGPVLAVSQMGRSTINAGGFTSLGGDSVLRFRAYYVNYYNTLDWFNDRG